MPVPGLECILHGPGILITFCCEKVNTFTCIALRCFVLCEEGGNYLNNIFMSGWVCLLFTGNVTPVGLRWHCWIKSGKQPQGTHVFLITPWISYPGNGMTALLTSCDVLVCFVFFSRYANWILASVWQCRMVSCASSQMVPFCCLVLLCPVCQHLWSGTMTDNI